MEKLFIRLQHTNRQIGSFRFKFNRQFLFLTWPKQSQYGALTYTYLFVSLRHWSSFFFVAGLPVFGISLAWVEHLRALFQFWSDHILHCHLQWGKLKQPFPFFLWIANREFFNELDMISVSFYVTVCYLRVYLRHYMVAVGMFYFSLRSISFWEWKKKPKLHWFCLGSVIGPENSRHYAIRGEIKTDHDLVALVFPRFRHSRCFTSVHSYLFQVFFFFLITWSVLVLTC